MRILALALAALIALPAIADAQRRPMRQSQPPSSPADSLASPEIPDQDHMRCVLQSIHMAQRGMALRCAYQNFSTNELELRLVAFDGGTQPGGISAAMTLAMRLDQLYPGENAFTIRYRAPSASAQAICAQVRNSSMSQYECVEAIAFGG
ncbi:MAG: hypothetical protein VX501_01100 [Pseudomonadota bacterium]|nr:hypothetical protein [Pseudomonadota bacterium]